MTEAELVARYNSLLITAEDRERLLAREYEERQQLVSENAALKRKLAEVQESRSRSEEDLDCVYQERDHWRAAHQAVEKERDRLQLVVIAAVQWREAGRTPPRTEQALADAVDAYQGVEEIK